MKMRLIQSLLSIAIVTTTLHAQKTAYPENLVGVGISEQTLFAYSSFGARLRNALVGDSALPPDVPVALNPVDPSALENAQVNSIVTFRVAEELDRKGLAYAYRGTLIDAKVKSIRTGGLRIVRGKPEPRVMEIAMPGLLETSPPPAPESLKLTLESTPRSRSSRMVKRFATSPLTVPLRAVHIAILIPESILLGIACSISGCDL